MRFMLLKKKEEAMMPRRKYRTMQKESAHEINNPTFHYNVNFLQV